MHNLLGVYELKSMKVKCYLFSPFKLYCVNPGKIALIIDYFRYYAIIVNDYCF